MDKTVYLVGSKRLAPIVQTPFEIAKRGKAGVTGNETPEGSTFSNRIDLLHPVSFSFFLGFFLKRGGRTHVPIEQFRYLLILMS